MIQENEKKNCQLIGQPWLPAISCLLKALKTLLPLWSPVPLLLNVLRGTSLTVNDHEKSWVKGGSILQWHNDCVWLISSGERFEKKACCGKEAHNTRSRRRHPRLKVEISSNGWMKPVLFTVHQADLWNELLVAMLSVKRCPPHTHTTA